MSGALLVRLTAPRGDVSPTRAARLTEGVFDTRRAAHLQRRLLRAIAVEVDRAGVVDGIGGHRRVGAQRVVAAANVHGAAVRQGAADAEARTAIVTEDVEKQTVRVVEPVRRGHP